MPPPQQSSSLPKYSPAVVSVVAGGGAGVVETTLTYPLDLVRTRVQMTKDSSTNLAVLLRSIVTEEGGIGRLYRGLLPPLISEVPRRALKFTAFDTYSRGLVEQDGGGESSASVLWLDFR
jgi:hypothetical protein